METSSPTHLLRDHTTIVWSLEWSPNGELLASCSLDGSVCLWEAGTGTPFYTFSDSKNPIISIAWAPDGQALALRSWDGSIHLLSIQTKELRQVLSNNGTSIGGSLAWSPNGNTIAASTLNNTLQFLTIGVKQANMTIEIPADHVTCMAWSPDGKMLASGSSDATIRLWNPTTGSQTNILQGHLDPIESLSFSADGRLLTSFSQQDSPYARGCFRIWHSDSWNLLYTVKNLKGVAPAVFHPKTPTLATISHEQTGIDIWNVSLSSSPSIGDASQSETVHYRNAKVVLVGDSSVGKTGLGLVLVGEDF